MVQACLVEGWVRDPKAEFVLRQAKITSKRIVLDLEKIDWQTTEKNAGRFHRIISDSTIEDFKGFIQRGDKMPMPVVAETAKGLFVVVAGVHRTKSALAAGKRTIAAYLASIEFPYQFRLVATLTNRLEGTRVTKEEALLYAVDLVTNGGLQPKEVAELLSVNLSSLNARLRCLRIRTQAIKAGSKKASQIADTTLKHLGPLTPNSKVLKAAVDYLYFFELGANEARDLALLVSKAKTEAQQLVIIEREASRRQREETPKASPVTLAIRTKFLRTFHALVGILDGKTKLADLQIAKDSDEIKGIRKEWRELKKALNGILK
jgi:ParB-like chromosome segregation protein Spo0J